jgi:hypothetical protein
MTDVTIFMIVFYLVMILVGVREDGRKTHLKIMAFLLFLE